MAKITNSKRKKAQAKSCYNADCYGASLSQCTQGAWQCYPGEYCHVQTSPSNGGLTLLCHTQDHFHENIHWCEHRQRENQLDCYAGHPTYACSFCCSDDQCVRGLSYLSPTTTATPVATAPSSPTTTPTVSSPLATATSTPGAMTTAPMPQPTVTLAPCRDLYAGDCGVDFAGRCSDTVVAHVCQKSCNTCQDPCRDMYAGDCTVDFAGRCSDPDIAHVCQKTCNACQDPCRDMYAGDCVVDFAGRCSDPDIAHVCQKTCNACQGLTSTTATATTSTALPSTTLQPSGACIDQLKGNCSEVFPNLCSNPTVMDVCRKTCNACPTPGPSTSTAPVTTATPAPPLCQDMYAGDCSVDYAGRCGEPTVQVVCPKFCGNCTPECRDLYTGDCAVDFAGRCGETTVANVCKKTCNRCTVWTCDDHYKGNCTQDFAGRCSDPLVSSVCQKMCGQCSGPTAPTTAPTTTATATATATATNTATTLTTSVGPSTSSAPVTTATPAPPLKCVQCGNYGNGTACTSQELVVGAVSECLDPGAHFCMTDVSVDAQSRVFVSKRCINRASCLNDWYLQTSDKNACLAFDPAVATSNLACHFCCVGDACNTQYVPAYNTQWRP